MSLYKRKGSPYWWTLFTVEGQPAVRKSTGTTDKGEAEQYEAKLKTQLWEEAKLGKKPVRLWQEAVVRWCTEQAHKRSLDDDKGHLRWLHPHLENMPLDKITRTVVDDLVVKRQQPRELKQPRGGQPRVISPKPATINRMLSLLRAILRRAEREWEWLGKAPAIRLLPEPRRRVRWITPEQAAALFHELPAHQREAVVFDLETGLRQGNVRGLKWSQVDMARKCAWIYEDEAKAGEAIPVPLSTLAREVLTRQIGNHDEYVFTYRGKPIGQLNTKAWKKALARAKIENFRWHDLRHTWASWHAQTGTPQIVLQELGGWKDAGMVRRYAHLSGDSLLVHAERRNAIIVELAQNQHTGKIAES